MILFLQLSWSSDNDFKVLATFLMIKMICIGISYTSYTRTKKKITNKKIVLLAINNLIKIINTDKPFITQLSIKKNQISFYTISK